MFNCFNSTIEPVEQEDLISVQTKIKEHFSIQKLSLLPSYAAFLLSNKLQEYAIEQVRLSRELQLPILNYLGNITDEQLLERTRKSSAEFLTYLSTNNIQQQIEDSMNNWLSNNLPIIDREDIAAEDITLISYIRKRVLQQFIPNYCNNVEQALELIREIDLYILELETIATNTYLRILKDRINEHSLLIEKVNNTIPGAVYVFDIINFKGVYSNNKLSEIIGYPHQELNTLGITAIHALIHPDDQQGFQNHLEELKKAKDGEIKIFKYRIKTKESGYKWLSNYESVFKRTEDGAVWQTIGITLDIDKEQKINEELQKSEERYRQAEIITHIGNYVWDLETNEVEWSEELYRIYGLDPKKDSINSELIQSFIIPEDVSKVRKHIRESIEEHKPFDYYFTIQLKNGTQKILKARGEILSDKNNLPVKLMGTVQDVTEKQNLIRKLSESEALYKQAQSMANLGNWSLDLDTGAIMWSDEMYKIYEIEKGTEINFKTWTNFIHVEEKDEVIAYQNKCLQEKSPYDRIHTIITGTGTKIIHRKGEFVFDKSGKAIRMVGTSQDITEQYRTQQELKENQAFIRKITDATPSIIASYNVNTGKYVFISEGMEKLLGYDRNVAQEQGVSFFMEIVHPEDLNEVMQKNARILEEANNDPTRNDLIAEFTYRMRHMNGQYRWFHTYGTIFDRNAEGKVEHVLNITLDVTEQIEASQKIKEQEHFIQQIADASPTILYLFDVETQSIAYINREIFFVLGYLPEEILDEGSNITEKFYHPEDYQLLPGRKQSGKTFQQVDSMIQYECRMKNKEGGWRWVLVREIVFKTDANGHIKQILGAALDINRRKDMEKTILQNAMLLEQSNASLEEFAYVASHDLKEPLRKISTFGDRLLATQENNLTPDGKIYLNKIVDASQRMQVMINDLLSISMISGNTAFEVYSLQKVLEETLQTLEFKIEQQNAIIRADNLPEAKIIPSQFRQLFQNLLSNSLKFVREDVQPLITIIHTLIPQHDVVHYQLAEAKFYHKIEFSDNGIGFENEFAGKIFAIFQRLHGRSEYEGSGIGLAICKKIVEHHGGIIYANGIPDQGATFTIILPA